MVDYNQIQPSSKALNELFINSGLIEKANTTNLIRAFNNSLFVNYAWDGTRPVGAIRCIGDSETVLYIEDIIVDKLYQNRNIGTNLLKSALKNFSNIPKIVFTCEYNDKTINFIKKFGFIDEVEYGKKTLIFLPKASCSVNKKGKYD